MSEEDIIREVKTALEEAMVDGGVPFLTVEEIAEITGRSKPTIRKYSRSILDLSGISSKQVGQARVFYYSRDGPNPKDMEYSVTTPGNEVTVTTVVPYTNESEYREYSVEPDHLHGLLETLEDQGHAEKVVDVNLEGTVNG